MFCGNKGEIMEECPTDCKKIENYYYNVNERVG